MSAEDRALAIGEPMPDIRLETVDGGELSLSSLRGRPLLAVCVRYYG
jgi:peroxiredoxin